MHMYLKVGVCMLCMTTLSLAHFSSQFDIFVFRTRHEIQQNKDAEESLEIAIKKREFIDVNYSRTDA